MQKTYNVIMTEYKSILKDWYKGTGGGSGEYNMFEDWSQEKLNKFDVDPQIYDHSVIEDRPPIMIDGYSKQKKYLTMMFLWDNKKDLLLASKYDPVKIGMGEAGIERDNECSIAASSDNTSSSRLSSLTSPGRTSNKKTVEEEAVTMVKTVLGLVMDKESTTVLDKDRDLALENQSLGELIKLVDMYTKTMEMRRSSGRLSDNQESKINSQIDYIMQIIEDRQDNRKRAHVDISEQDVDSNNNSNVS